MLLVNAEICKGAAQSSYVFTESAVGNVYDLLLCISVSVSDFFGTFCLCLSQNINNAINFGYLVKRGYLKFSHNDSFQTHIWFSILYYKILVSVSRWFLKKLFVFKS